MGPQKSQSSIPRDHHASLGTLDDAGLMAQLLRASTIGLIGGTAAGFVFGSCIPSREEVWYCSRYPHPGHGNFDFEHAPE